MNLLTIKFRMDSKYDVQIIESNRGGQLLVVNSYKYRKCSVRQNGEIHWRCCMKTCNGAVYTLGENNIVSRVRNHCHEPNIKAINKQVVNSVAKRKSIEDPTETPSKIFQASLNYNVNAMDTLSAKDMNNIKRNMSNARRKIKPNLNKSCGTLETEKYIEVPKNIILKTPIPSQIIELIISSKWEQIYQILSEKPENKFLLKCKNSKPQQYHHRL